MYMHLCRNTDLMIIDLELSPEIMGRAQQLAKYRNTNVSALVLEVFLAYFTMINLGIGLRNGKWQNVKPKQIWRQVITPISLQ